MDIGPYSFIVLLRFWSLKDHCLDMYNKQSFLENWVKTWKLKQNYYIRIKTKINGNCKEKNLLQILKCFLIMDLLKEKITLWMLFCRFGERRCNSFICSSIFAHLLLWTCKRDAEMMSFSMIIFFSLLYRDCCCNSIWYQGNFWFL